jgi:transcriptional regulator with XRE-family HTH domain
VHPIRFNRTARGWTQAEFAAHLGVSANAVQAWEHGGKIRPKNLARLAKVLLVDARKLLAEIEAWKEAQRRDQL